MHEQNPLTGIKGNLKENMECGRKRLGYSTRRNRQNRNERNSSTVSGPLRNSFTQRKYCQWTFNTVRTAIPHCNPIQVYNPYDLLIVPSMQSMQSVYWMQSPNDMTPVDGRHRFLAQQQQQTAEHYTERCRSRPPREQRKARTSRCRCRGR